MRGIAPVVVAAVLLAAPGRADLKAALAERNLERRSQLAMDNAFVAYQTARTAYQKGESDQIAPAVTEIGESVDLALQSLNSTGKDPRKSPKWFKKAEIETRDLMRKLDAFEQEMSFSERDALAKVKARVTEVHDQLLLGLMEGKRK